MGMTVLIPWLVGQAVNAIEPPSDKSAILPLALAIVGAGILRLGLTVVRRLIAGRVSVDGRVRPAGADSTGTCRRSSSASSTPSRPAS